MTDEEYICTCGRHLREHDDNVAHMFVRAYPLPQPPKLRSRIAASQSFTAKEVEVLDLLLNRVNMGAKSQDLQQLLRSESGHGLLRKAVAMKRSIAKQRADHIKYGKNGGRE